MSLPNLLFFRELIYFKIGMSFPFSTSLPPFLFISLPIYLFMEQGLTMQPWLVWKSDILLLSSWVLGLKDSCIPVLWCFLSLLVMVLEIEPRAPGMAKHALYHWATPKPWEWSNLIVDESIF